jgi:Zn-finger nucleic acid-binding protein
VPTVFAARQFVNHGHVLVNGKRVNIASYRVKAGDVVAVRERSRNMALVLEAIQSSERDIPDYIQVDGKGLSATYVRVPELSEVPVRGEDGAEPRRRILRVVRAPPRQPQAQPYAPRPQEYAQPRYDEPRRYKDDHGRYGQHGHHKKKRFDLFDIFD